MKNLAYVIVLDSRNQPLFSQVLESETQALEFELIVYSSLDQFNSLSKQYNDYFSQELKEEVYGGYLGSHVYENDVYYVYGNSFGNGEKVIAITKNTQMIDRSNTKSVRIIGISNF